MSQDLYKRILDTWGLDSQLNMMTEEMGELLQAMSKFRRSQNKSDEVKKVAYIHLCEEIGDVENMINQLRYTFDSDLIDKFKEKKLKRISDKLDNYNNEG